MGPQDQAPVPQPAPQPQQPMQMQSAKPGGFEPGPQPMMATPGPKKGLSKGALLGIIGGAVGLVLLIVGVILAITLLGGPTKDDYRKVSDVYGEATSAYNSIGSKGYELTSTSSTETSRKNTIESMKSLQSTFNSKFEEAGKMKGIANDKDLKEKWTKAEEKRAKFNATLEELYEISEKVLPAITEISDLSSPTVTQLSTLRNKVDGLKVKNGATNDYLAALSKFLKAAEDYSAYRATGTYDSTAYTKYSAATNAYYDASKDWSSSIEKLSDEAEMKDQLNALRDSLMNKVLGVK